MTTVTRFHVSWLQTSAVPEFVAGGAGTPSLSELNEYSAAFAAAPAVGAAWMKPWGNYSRGHRYWSNLLGSAYARADTLSAWTKQVPLRRADGYTPGTELSAVIVGCERFLYPSGVGVAITATFDGELPLPGALSLHSELCQGPVFVGSDRVARRIKGILAYVLEELENEVLGNPSSAPVRSQQQTITTIAGSTGKTKTGAATETLKQLCYPGQQPGRTTIFPNRTGNFSGTIRAAGQRSQATWSPIRSATTAERNGLTCYHRNVLLATLHTMQLLNLTELAGDDFASDADRAQQLYRRAGTVLGWLYGGASAYSTRFTPKLIDDSGLRERIDRIRLRLSGDGPLRLRD